VIKKGEESSPSSFSSLSTQMTIPQSCPLNTEAEQNSILKVETDHLSLDIIKPVQVASTQSGKVAYQMIEEEDAQLWDSSLDEDCSKKHAEANDVSMPPAQEYNGASFILVVQATDDVGKYTISMIIQ